MSNPNNVVPLRARSTTEQVDHWIDSRARPRWAASTIPLAACTADACNQGRRECPVPQQCWHPEPPLPTGRRVPIEEARQNAELGFYVSLAIWGAVIVGIALLAAMWRH